MKLPKTHYNFFTHAALVTVAVALGLSSANAQTPPTPETTFTNVSGNLWGTVGNWSGGVPDPLDTSLDDVLIGANQTAVYDQAIQGAAAFGTLTLGAGATLQNKITATTFMAGKTVYLNDGSIFEITSGSLNSVQNYQIVSGATATLRGNLTMVQGSIAGAGNLNVTLSGNPEWRATGTNLTGDLTFSSNGTASRRVGVSRYAGINVFGTGTATFNDNTYFQTSVNGNTTNKLSSSSTLKMVGDSGATNAAKLQMSTNNQTVSNLVVESPGVALTGVRALLTTGSTTVAGTLTVSNTTTFQGTANTVEIDNLMTTPTGNSLVTKNLTFGGTGDWAVIGDGRISLSSGSTITTTDVNASIANSLVGSNGFEKAGNGKLTLTGDLSGLSGTVNVTGGELAMSGTASGLTLNISTALTIGSSASATDQLDLGSSNLILGDNSIINWKLGSIVSEYDRILTTGTLDLAGISNIVINGTSLGYDAQVGDTFTLFSGTVTNFNAGKFTLNLPTLTTGTWALQEGSLLLTVIPEPSGLLLTGLGLFGLMLRRRR
jgi:fibronectin-binding autotransporter adhesin